ncbi:ATPase [Thiohalocapsa marina]|uniref:ATPase n=1 Tax=Thiohalocapsa marina TaxID=424902 RepID=A0A5M8FJ40_9GAMM|nr:V-type ATPase 116kDa subunit family protein [Thiohalocapsa marina]KAA6184953.1 ATPase [Thiohalocapsa marina]
MLRPVATRWFEVLCPRAESVHTLAALAQTGAVELELRAHCAEDCPLTDVATGLAAYQALLPRYQRYWQRGRLRHTPLVEAPMVVIERALARIAAWRREADPLIEQLQSAEEELTRLKWLQAIISQIEGSALDFSLVTASGPLLGTFCAIVPARTRLDLPDWALPRGVPWQDEHCYMILTPLLHMDEAKARIKAHKGRIVERPAWLGGDATAALARLRARRAWLSERCVTLYAELDTLFEEYALDATLGEVAWLDWFSAHVGALELASEHLVWITGWTDDIDGRRLADALDQADTRALLRLTRPPAGARPPQVLRNPPWLRPFELFARALGVPASDEADPTPLLAVVVPLLFGYMFGDVGQGLVLVLAGLWLSRRFDAARLMVLGGASAMVFGLLFGSLFGMEHLFPPLWLHPLAHPLLVLAVPLVFAVGLLSLGQLLSGLGALRRGQFGAWLRVDAGFLVLYLGLVLALALPGSGLGWLAVVGLVWYLGGAFVQAHRLLGALSALGHLAENGLQLLTNTLSFARVGAFALAHAALSSAIVTMAAAAPAWAGLLILLLGNVVVILLEGLVVSIQTTRLVLFEFFNRFLRGNGRRFLPLPAPPPLVTPTLASGGST